MVRCLKNFNTENFLDILTSKQLIDQNTKEILKTAHPNIIIEKIVDDGIVDEDTLIGILHQHYDIPILDIKNPDQIKILEYYKFSDYIENGYFIYQENSGKKFVAVNNPKYLTKPISYLNIKLIKKKPFYQLLDENFGHFHTTKSKYLLDFISPKLTAKNIDYKKAMIGFFISFITLLICSNIGFHIVNSCCYLTQNILKMFLFKQALVQDDILLSTEDLKYLPKYSILIPLYKEKEKLKSIIKSVKNLTYPKNKLDVKLVVEIDDDETNEILNKLSLPPYIHVVKVPVSFPRTKPKALNYAIQYCRGEYVVIYDAEDRPEHDQLLKAVSLFNHLPDEYACLQAKLNFYNKDENLLTKFFSIEYSMWFEYLLKGLSLFRLPIMLGGTSNHFKIKILRSIGSWDAYNVTEDADLGIRLFIAGYKVNILDSYTLEEAPISIGSWLNQRTRWIKGHIQTFLVLLNNPHAHLGIMNILVIYVMVGISSYGFCCLPWLLFTIAINSKSFINSLWLVNSFFTFSYMYGAAFHILLSKRKKIRRFRTTEYIALIFWPLYFALHTVSSYKALWESFKRPFEWNKTTHGVSQKSN